MRFSSGYLTFIEVRKPVIETRTFYETKGRFSLFEVNSLRGGKKYLYFDSGVKDIRPLIMTIK